MGKDRSALGRKTRVNSLARQATAFEAQLSAVRLIAARLSAVQLITLDGALLKNSIEKKC